MQTSDDSGSATPTTIKLRLPAPNSIRIAANSLPKSGKPTRGKRKTRRQRYEDPSSRDDSDSPVATQGSASSSFAPSRAPPSMSVVIRASTPPLPDGIDPSLLLPEDEDGVLARCFLSRQLNRSTVKRVLRVAFEFSEFDEAPPLEQAPKYAQAFGSLNPVGVGTLMESLAKPKHKRGQTYEPTEDPFATARDMIVHLNRIWIGTFAHYGKGHMKSVVAAQAMQEVKTAFDRWKHGFIPCDEPDKEYCVVCGSGSSPSDNAIVFCPKCGCGRH